MTKKAKLVLKLGKLPPDGRGKPVDYEGIRSFLLKNPFQWAVLFQYNYPPGPAGIRMRKRLGEGYEVTTRKNGEAWCLWGRYCGTPQSWPSLGGETGEPAAEVREKSTQ